MIERLSDLAGRDVSRETFDRLSTYVELLRDEAQRQNLVSAATLSNVWQRHIADSVQILSLSAKPDSSWVDIGSGAGLPGIPIALLSAGPMTLVEPRRLRADFLGRCVDALDLDDRVTVVCGSAEALRGRFANITARAVARLDRLLSITRHLSENGTQWILPKGKSAINELEEARISWQCDARVEQSRTDVQSHILLLSEVRAGPGR